MSYPRSPSVSLLTEVEPALGLRELARYERDGLVAIYNLRARPGKFSVWVNAEADGQVRTIDVMDFADSDECGRWLRSEARRLSREGWTPRQL